MIVILVLCFYRLNTRDAWSWEDIGYRTGFVSIAQLPLIVLLAGKDNILGLLSGVGHERLNWLHRWTARALWLSATLHMGFWFRSWDRYDYVKVKVKSDAIVQRGLAAWCILTFVFLTSAAPVRNLNYELFILSHLITFAGLIAAIWLHVPEEVKVWIWLPIGFFALDRLLRTRRLLYLNLTLFHFWKRQVSGPWANLASFARLPCGVTKITVDKPAFTWKPGQHVFLSCHSIIPIQSHPFTIASLPSDGKLEFLVQAQRGGTKTLFNHVVEKEALPLTRRKDQKQLTKIGIEGPYGRMRTLGQFDSVILFAGSTGATFTVPHLRHLVRSWQLGQEQSPHKPRAQSQGALTRSLRFVWVIKSRDQLHWFHTELHEVIDSVTRCRVNRPKDDRQIDISVYVTCDEKFVAEKSSGDCCQPLAHGKVEQVDAGSDNKITTEKKEMGHDAEVRPLDSGGQSGSEDVGFAPDGSCCCKATVEDESDAPVCTCSGESNALSTPNRPTGEVSQEASSSPKPSLRILAGRPQPRSIIRKALEEAEGESAVVVCGPIGLRDDVRASVVGLSDERAVHKGTGAQGIYLHVEGFDY